MNDEEQTPAGAEQERGRTGAVETGAVNAPEAAAAEAGRKEISGETEPKEATLEEVAEAGVLWSVGREAQRFFPAALDDTFLLGVTGGALRHAAAPLLRSDLTHWIAPGLAFCGVSAQITPVPADLDACLHWLCAHVQSNSGVCAFAFGEVLEEETSRSQHGAKTAGRQIAPPLNSRINRGRLAAQKDDVETERLALPRCTDPPLAWEARIVAVDAERREVTLLDSRERPSPCTLPELQSYFSHILTVSKAPQSARKAEQRDFALRAWAAFACAYPERLLDTGENDTLHRRQAGDFWRALAGRERSEAGQRLREAADLFQSARHNADIDAALRLLYKQMCYELRLPPLLENALLAPDDVVLSDAERRELIYMARAGTRDLKILAAYRLQPETEQAEARATLLQLQHDPDAWVRGAAR